MPHKKSHKNAAANRVAKSAVLLGLGFCLPVYAQSLVGTPVPPQLSVEPTMNAEITVGEFEAAPFDDKTKMYLHGVESGLRYAIIINEMNGLPTVYCAPKNKQFSSRDLVGFVAQEIEQSPSVAADKSLPIVAVLLRALQKAYPCTSQRN